MTGRLLGVTALGLLALGGATAALHAQDPVVRPAFEVASIKPHSTDATYRFTFAPGGAFTATLPLEWLIGLAWDVRPMDRIVGEPAWVRTQYFSVEAKPATKVSRPETMAMLRTLIEDRFGLVWRLDPNGTGEAHALTLAREDKALGPAIRRTETACVTSGAPIRPIAERRLQPGVAVPCGISRAGDVTAAGSMPMTMLVSTIQLALGEEVVDRTGLSGNFDYYVTLPRNSQQPGAQDPAEVSIFTAVREQLGMKLERQEITRDAFVVEKVSPPTPN